MTRNHKTDWNKDKGMKAIIKDLKSAHGIEAEPMTHGTRAMLVHILYYQLPRLENIHIRLRTQFLLIAEAIGGLRVGEAIGEVHGLRAINTCVLKEISTGKRSVEVGGSRSLSKQRALSASQSQPTALQAVVVATRGKLGRRLLCPTHPPGIC